MKNVVNLDLGKGTTGADWDQDPFGTQLMTKKIGPVPTITTNNCITLFFNFG